MNARGQVAPSSTINNHLHRGRSDSLGVGYAGRDGWRALAAAIIYQAMLDAHAGKRSAIKWLKTEAALLCEDFLDIPHAALLAWLKHGRRFTPANQTRMYSYRRLQTTTPTLDQEARTLAEFQDEGNNPDP